MIVSIASGKGGTGKTTIATNLALSAVNAQLVDCDVEEPNSHIFLKPSIDTSEPVTVLVPVIDKQKCNFCGRCQEVCQYNAIAVMKKEVLLFNELCHSCGGCVILCPRGAISEREREIGIVEKGLSGNVAFVHGKLNIGEVMAPPLIRAVKKNIDNQKNVIIDAPPGTSCPVIEAVKGSNYCLLVTEPTPFGLNDLKLAVAMLRTIGIDFGVVINRSDLGNKDTVDYCAGESIPVLASLPFKKEIAVAYSEGIPIIESIPEYRAIFTDLYKRIFK